MTYISWSSDFSLSTTASNRKTSYFGYLFSLALSMIHLSISDGFVQTKLYDKRDDFDFDIVNFPFLDSSSFDILWCLYFSAYSIC